MITSLRHTDRLMPLVLERTISSAPSILLRDVLASNIPSGVRSYLLAEVTRWLLDDLRTLPRYTMLRLDAPGVEYLQISLLRSMATSYPLPRAEFLAAVRVSLEFTEAYLTRPQWTLETFLFEDEEQVTPRHIRDRLGHVTDYAYLPRLLEGWMRRRGSRPVLREDFRHLLGRIDDEIVKQHRPRELALLTKPIFDFLLLKNSGPDDPIALAPLLAFFEDKKMKILTEYIESICRLRGTEMITLTQLTGLLEELYDGRTANEASAASEPALRDLETGPPPGADEYPDEQPSGFRVEEGSAAVGEDLDSPPPNAQHTPTLEPTPATDAGADLPDLRTLISEKQRYRFIRRVFQKDQAYYYGVLATLNALPTWTEASAYLGQVYEINDLDPYAEDVIEFTDTIHRRYVPPPEIAL